MVLVLVLVLVTVMVGKQGSSNGSLTLDLLWKDYFREPYLWHDNRSFNKTHFRCPDFKHRITHQCLWIDGWFKPSWVSIELQKRIDIVTHGERAKENYEELRNEEFSFVASLKTCAKKKDLHEGTRLHALIREKWSLEKNSYLATTLISMYAVCGLIGKAQELHDELPIKSVDSWNALISGYSRQGKGRSALDCFENMENNGFSPDEVTFICVLKACGSIRSIIEGKKIHNRIVSRGLLESNVKLGTVLVDMYVKCGLLIKAREVHDQLCVRDSVSWSVLITGYAHLGQGHEALCCFEHMQLEGLSPDAVTFTCILKVCGSLGAIHIGTQIHDDIVRGGLLEKDIMLSTALVDMYAKCGLLIKAKQVHDELRVRSVVSWSALIAGYTRQRQGHEALHCFEQMQREGHFPDAITWISVLAACGSIGNLQIGEQIHNEIASRGLLERDIDLGSALVDMYVQCGVLAKAQQIHDKLPIRGIASWNTLIAGYAQHGYIHEAVDCFQQMQDEGHFPDAITFTCMAKVYGSTGSIGKGKEMHDEVMSRGLLGKDIELNNALIDMYAKFGMLTKAEELHNEICIKSVVSWNVLIAGYAQHGRGHEALVCYEKMQREGITSDEVTFTCILKVCGSIGAIDKGKQIHDEIVHRGFIEKNIMLGTALVDMYMKCHKLAKAQEVHDQLCVRDVVSWSTLIAGHAQIGQGQEALTCFAQMQREGVSADAITFLSILNACNHTGLIDEANTYYSNMSTKHGIIPDLQHHICMVLVFGCVGHFDLAVSVIKTMPPSNHPLLWLALLGGCKRSGNIMLGRLAFDHVIHLDKNCAAGYVLMADIYADSGMQEDANKIKAMKLKNAQ